MKEKIFYVYIDRTDDGRVFYIGKGLMSRIRRKEARNKYWKNIANKYGWSLNNREIVMGTKDENFAFQEEIRLIKNYKTFEGSWQDKSGWGANLTCGGEGVSGLSGELSALFGKPLSGEHRKKLTKAYTGRNGPNFGKKGSDHPTFGKKQLTKKKKKNKEETKEKFGTANSGPNHHGWGKVGPNAGKPRSKEASLKSSISQTGEGNSRALLTIRQIKEIRVKYATGNFFQKDLAKEYNVSRGCIGGIVIGKTWKSVK